MNIIEAVAKLQMKYNPPWIKIYPLGWYVWSVVACEPDEFYRYHIIDSIRIDFYALED